MKTVFDAVTAADGRVGNGLYRLAGMCALLMALIVPAQVVVFSAWPAPDSVLGWFELFQRNVVIGMLSFEFLFLVYGLLSIPFALAAYHAVRRAAPALAGLFLMLGLVGAVGAFTGRPVFEMLYLSGRYFAAGSEAQSLALLAAGESVLAIWHGTSFAICYALGSINGLILAVAMLRSGVFGRGLAWLRLASSVLDAGLLLPGIGLYLSVGSALVLMGWNAIMACRLLRMQSDAVRS